MKTETSNLNAVQQKAVEAVKLQEVTNHYFGTIVVAMDSARNTPKEEVKIMIKKNTEIPCEVTDTVYTLYENQTEVECTVTQDGFGSDNPKMVKKVKELTLGPLPANRPQGQPIEVTYIYDSNQKMSCKFKDVNSNKEVEAEIFVEGTSKKEIESSKDELEMFILE